MNSKGAYDIAVERHRQVVEEAQNEDYQWNEGELWKAAVCYILSSSLLWPWDMSWWKPKNRRRDLVRAGALIAAEIDRIDMEDRNYE